MSDSARLAARLRKLALGYPETYEESPWGDRVVKVKGKIFLFCGAHDGRLQLSLKLPSSGREVLRESWAKPTPYGLGKSGWVSLDFPPGKAAPEGRIAQWIDESYRALAPKKLVASLGANESENANATANANAQKIGATKKPRRLTHRVMLVCEDSLRIERAERALAAHGVTVGASGTSAAARKKLGQLDAVIIDVGRSADDGLSLAAEVDASDHPIHLFIVGIRDARSRKRAEQAATSAELFRAPPGDPEVAAAIATTLAAHPRRSPL